MNVVRAWIGEAGTGVAVVQSGQRLRIVSRSVIMIEKTTNIVGYLESGIRAEALRQKAIASNIANSETPGYQRVDVRFADLVANAMESGGEPDEIEGEFFKPMNTEVNSKGNDVSLDAEIGEMVKNSLLHKTYMKLLARKYRQVETAINTGG
jgi:flagellar basal-body rod protein FlgB